VDRLESSAFQQIGARALLGTAPIENLANPYVECWYFLFLGGRSEALFPARSWRLKRSNCLSIEEGLNKHEIRSYPLKKSAKRQKKNEFRSYLGEIDPLSGSAARIRSFFDLTQAHWALLG